VIVDMHDVTFCGSEGLLWLLALEEFVRRRGRQMRVRNPSATVARLLDLVCLTRLTDGVADGERPRR
jgi:anti-anti-sigma factor